MGLGANFPLALAPGMGLDALVAFQLAPHVGGWQTAMGLIVLDGLVVLALVLVGVREAVLRAIPLDLRRAISVGIGLFIAFIGLGNARLVTVPPGSVAALGANALASVPPLGAGNLHAPEALVAMLGVLVIGVLLVRKTPGAILIGSPHRRASRCCSASPPCRLAAGFDCRGSTPCSPPTCAGRCSGSSCRCCSRSSWSTSSIRWAR